ncbi:MULTISPECIES: DUF4922 domain-containing protein [Lactococcus]|uniref:Uncharacterized protein n=1 Tax=Lactococcus lactis subsp. lactis TaxID=1360 RepID=A0A1V0NEX7_LACLL|nr:DUF4922 domain-containing protein [Lactococcus lactis]ARD98501.1 hypothetical protein LL275_0869 [Lactococcus lactis subsp. lactis]MDS1012888.1 DUF4922 domain-containing protein [Lactococcus lactis]NLS47342.1 hypothetical protein [Lactococcus lactis]TKD78610.1 hypothetical protein E6O52_02830 [Lactococcus lactis]UXV69038.1 DUF4922 domain-containing protein [Lactococcus lactis subsp. lactis]
MLVKFDRELYLKEMQCKVRFIPSFEKRYYDWEQKSVNEDQCPFCEKWSVSDTALLPFFHIIKNDYPFMNNQFTVFGKLHQQFFNPKQISLALQLIHSISDCKSGGLQISGSGASIPKHAHFSISDEIYPISTLKREVLIDNGDYEICRVLGTPHLVLVITGNLEKISMVTSEILSSLLHQNFSYNLLLTEAQEIFIIPRTNEVSISLGRKVGVSLVGGIYPCYVKITQLHAGHKNILSKIFDHWEKVTAKELVQALTDTTLPSSLERPEVLKLLNMEH